MKYLLSTISFTILSVLISTTIKAQKAEKNYATYCAVCHGKKLEGSSVASALIKTDWKQGSDKASITKTISKGIPKTTMVAWGNVLSKKDVEEMAEFILSKQEEK